MRHRWTGNTDRRWLVLAGALIMLSAGAATSVEIEGPAASPTPILYEEAKLLASDGGAGDTFGYVSTSSIDGDLVLIGAPRHDGHAEGTGAAYLFQRDESGRWEEVAKLEASDAAAYDLFGGGVSLSGDRALVGAYQDDDLGMNSGSAYLFERGESGRWEEVAKLLASDGTAHDAFGAAVSLSGDRALVGAVRYHWPDRQVPGAAYLFERDESGGWVEVARLSASDASDEDKFGGAVDLSGDRAIVGATNAGPYVCDSHLCAHTGTAYVFERDDQGNWAEVDQLLASDGSAWDHFGGSVSVSGDRTLVGAPYSDGGFLLAGSAYLFEPDGSGVWREVAKLQASDGEESDRFGVSVSLSGHRALITAGGDALDTPEPLAPQGSAYFFERGRSGNWLEVAKLRSSDSQGFDRASLAGDRAVLGCVYDCDDLGEMSGAAYAFSFEKCHLEVRLEPRALRAGDDLDVAIHLEHNRLQTVTVPLRAWIEAADGTPIAGQSSPPLTFHYGDEVDRRLMLTLPPGTAPGFYRVVVGVERMEQGIAWAAQPFQVQP